MAATRNFPLAQAGKAELIFHPNISRFYVASPDGAIKIFNVESPDVAVAEVHQADAPDRAILSIAISASGSVLVSGGESRTGHVWSVAADGSLTSAHQTIGRSTSPLRYVALAPRGNLALSLSDDFNLRLENILIPSPAAIMKGHDGGRGAAFDPHGAFLVTIGWEGNVNLWDLNSTSSPIRSFQRLLTRTDPATGVTSSPHWNADGSLLAVPTPKGVQLYPRPDIATIASWAPLHTLGGKEITLVRFSPNGLYLATVDTTNQIEIWDTVKRDSLERHKHPFPLQSIAWSPLTNLVAYTDNSTAFVLWDKPVPASLPSPVDMSAAQGLASAVASQLPAVEFENKPAAPTKARQDDVGMTTRDNNEESDGGSGTVVRSKKVKREDREVQVESSEDENQRRIAELRNRKRKQVSEMQAAFQPGAYGDQKRKVLCWNAVARVVRIEHEAGRASVEVHFTDSAVSRPIKLVDRLTFSLGSVSSTLLALASETHLHVRPVQQVVHNAEWSISLQEGEQFIALAVGARAVAAGTSAGYLRVYSATGFQLACLRMPRLVALAAHDDTLGVLSNTAGGEKSLQLLHMTRITRMAEERCPVVGNGAVRWIGFSASALPLIQDSEGVLSGICGGLWHPLHILQSDQWLVAVTDAEVLSAPCNNAHFPAISPLPPLEAKPLQLPFQVDTAAGVAAEQLARELVLWETALRTAKVDLALGVDGDRLMRQRSALEKKTLVPQIASALAEGKSVRAVELAQLLHIPANLQLAFRTFLQKRGTDASVEEFVARLEQLKPVVRANGLYLAERCKSNRAPPPAPVQPPSDNASQPSAPPSAPAPTAKALPPLPSLSSKITVADAGAQSPDEDEEGAGEPAAAATPQSPPPHSSATSKKAEKVADTAAKEKRKAAKESTKATDAKGEKNQREMEAVEVQEGEATSKPDALKKRRVGNPFAVSTLNRGATMAGKQLASVLGQLDKK